MSQKKHNPEKRAWRGKSYKKGNRRGAKASPSVRDLRDEAKVKTS